MMAWLPNTYLDIMITRPGIKAKNFNQKSETLQTYPEAAADCNCSKVNLIKEKIELIVKFKQRYKTSLRLKFCESLSSTTLVISFEDQKQT